MKEIYFSIFFILFTLVAYAEIEEIECPYPSDWDTTYFMDCSYSCPQCCYHDLVGYCWECVSEEVGSYVDIYFDTTAFNNWILCVENCYGGNLPKSEIDSFLDSVKMKVLEDIEQLDSACICTTGKQIKMSANIGNKKVYYDGIYSQLQNVKTFQVVINGRFMDHI